MKIVFSIKSKLTLAIALLMVTSFVIFAFLFINEKKMELSSDVYQNVKTFAELTAPKVADYTDLYLKQDGFVYFNKEVNKLFEQLSDVNAIQVVSYKGEIIYDSVSDKEARYNGEKRIVADGLLEQVKAKNSSFEVGVGFGEGESGAVSAPVFYLKDGQFVDSNEAIISAPREGFRISYFVQPANDKYSVIYGVDYTAMDTRILRMQHRIMATAFFGLMMGVMLAFYLGSKVTKPVSELAIGASEIAKGNFKYKVDIRSRDELGFLSESFNKMADDLEASLEARVYKERVGQELELARKIQEELIPKVLPKISGLDVAASLVPATEVGGDVYDVIPVGDEALIYLGDVTGHGVPSCIISAIANSLFYSYSEMKDLKAILGNVNRILKKKMMSTMFMTVGMVKWQGGAVGNGGGGKLTYVNAGHEPLMVYSAKKGEVVLYSSPGMALGMVADLTGKISEISVELEKGDIAILFSDGIIEAWKNEKDTYGIEKLRAKVLESAKSGIDAKGILDVVQKDICDFTNCYEQKDDMTVVVMKAV